MGFSTGLKNNIRHLCDMHRALPWWGFFTSDSEVITYIAHAARLLALTDYQFEIVFGRMNLRPSISKFFPRFVATDLVNFFQTRAELSDLGGAAPPRPPASKSRELVCKFIKWALTTSRWFLIYLIFGLSLHFSTGINLKFLSHQVHVNIFGKRVMLLSFSMTVRAIK